MFLQLFFPSLVNTGTLLLELLVSGLIVVVAAIRLTTLADRFADEWGLGKAFVGMLLLATVTSLPEVVAGATAGAIGAVDMAFGAVYGSCSFNIVIIVIMNLMFAAGGSVLRSARPTQFLNSSFGIVMITLSLMAMTTVHRLEGHPLVQQVVEVVAVVGIVAAYVVCMYLAQQFEKRDLGLPEDAAFAKRSIGLVFQIFIVSAITMGAAWWLTQTGDKLATHPIDFLGGRALGASLVGILFLAIASSLPEIATSVTAVRIGNVDMALGNVFGSNMFNILVLPVVKIATLATGDSLMMSGDNFDSNTNVLAGLLPILLTAAVIGAIAFRTQRRLFRLGYDSVILLIIYLAGMFIILGT